MAHMASILGTATANLAAWSCEQLLGRVPIWEHQVILGAHGEERNLYLPNSITHAALLIVVNPIFVAEHLDIDLKVQGVKPTLVVLKHVHVVFVVLLAEVLLHLWHLLSLDQVVQMQANDLLELAKAYIVKELVTILGTPGRSIEDCAVKNLVGFFAHIFQVQAQDVCAKTACKCIESFVMLLNILFVGVLKDEFDVLPAC